MPPASLRRSAVAPLAILLVIASVACTGPRSSVDKTDAPVGTVSLPGGAAGSSTSLPDVDAVLALLEGPLPASFTTVYSIDRHLGAVRADATVAHGPLATSVTVRDTRFLLDDTAPRTCDLRTRTCQGAIVDARISDLGVGAHFWRDSPARALRVAAARRAAPTTGSTTTIAGQTATCVDVPVGTGVEHYCALPTGVLARWDTAYVDIEATSARATADQEAFALPG